MHRASREKGIASSIFYFSLYNTATDCCFSVCVRLYIYVCVCLQLYFMSNAMHAHTDNWHFKGITLDKATWTNERKRHNDLSEGGGLTKIFWFTFFFLLPRRPEMNLRDVHHTPAPGCASCLPGSLMTPDQVGLYLPGAPAQLRRGSAALLF